MNWIMISSKVSILIRHSPIVNYLQCIHVVILGFLIHTVTSFTESSHTPTEAVYLSLVASCGPSATLYWSRPQLSKLCELTVYETGKMEAQIVDIYPDSKNHHIKLSNLKTGQNYSAFIACDQNMKTSIISFIIGKSCEGTDVPKENHNRTVNTTGESSTVEALHSNDLSTVGLLSAVIFSIIAVVLVASVAYFMWKKYRHRQRILRIFRQEHNDPFQALYNPAQDAYNV